MKRSFERIVPFSACLLCFALAGCGPRELAKKTTYPVKGRLLLNKQPVRFAIITLTPTDKTKGINADATTNDKGEFHVRTYSNQEADGEVPGEYTLTVEEYDGARVARIGKAEPTKFPRGFKQRTVTVEVLAEETDLSDIEIGK
jgi:hypothetical protein